MMEERGVQITSRDIMKLFISCPMPHCQARSVSQGKISGIFGWQLNLIASTDSRLSFFVLATFVLHLVSTPMYSL
jgi:hypothetical protein